MLPQKMVLAIFSCLLAQGNIVQALPHRPHQTRSERIDDSWKRDLDSSLNPMDDAAALETRDETSDENAGVNNLLKVFVPLGGVVLCTTIWVITSKIKPEVTNAAKATVSESVKEAYAKAKQMLINLAPTDRRQRMQRILSAMNPAQILEFFQELQRMQPDCPPPQSSNQASSSNESPVK